MRQSACEAQGMTFAVTSLDVRTAAAGRAPDSAAQLAEWMASATAANVGAAWPPQAAAGASAPQGGDAGLRFRLEGRRDEGQPIAVEVRIRVVGPWVLQAAVVGSRLDAQAVETFLDSVAPRRLPGIASGG